MRRALRKIFGLLFLLPCIANAAIIWNAENAEDNAKDIVKLIARAEKDLKLAIEIGDVDGLNKYITVPFARVLRAWTEQRRELNNPLVERYAVCHDAAFEFQFYSLTFTKKDTLDVRRERESTNSRYRKYLENCKRVISKK